MTPPREVNSIYTNQRGIQGKEGDTEVGPVGLNTPNPTLPLNLRVPLGEQKKRQATVPVEALKDKSREDLRKGQVTSVKHGLGGGQVELFKNMSRKTIQS